MTIEYTSYNKWCAVCQRRMIFIKKLLIASNYKNSVYPGRRHYKNMLQAWFKIHQAFGNSKYLRLTLFLDLCKKYRIYWCVFVLGKIWYAVMQRRTVDLHVVIALKNIHILWIVSAMKGAKWLSKIINVFYDSTRV